MQNRVVEIANDGLYLSLTRGFLKVSKDGDEIGRIPIPDIGALIVRGFGAGLSLNLAARLAEQNIPVVLCGADQSPASIVWPVAGHHAQGLIIESQAGLSAPARKRLWQALVRAKIKAQAEALTTCGAPSSDLLALARRVKSGDSENLEALAARRYWSRLMKPVEVNFVRDKGRDGCNAALNYGYTVLRAGVARSILAAGLHPSLSIQHVSRGDPFRLADDLIEPFRPYVDIIVRKLAAEAQASNTDIILDKRSKTAIVDVLSLDVEGPYGASPLQTAMDRLCQSFASVCRKERTTLELPQGAVFTTERARETSV